MEISLAYLQQFPEFNKAKNLLQSIVKEHGIMSYYTLKQKLYDEIDTGLIEPDYMSRFIEQVFSVAILQNKVYCIQYTDKDFGDLTFGVLAFAPTVILPVQFECLCLCCHIQAKGFVMRTRRAREESGSDKLQHQHVCPPLCEEHYSFIEDECKAQAYRLIPFESYRMTELD